MANPTWKKGMKTPNAAGRKGAKQKNVTPVEFKRMMTKLRKLMPEALDILEQQMSYEVVDDDGNIRQVVDTKLAEKIIQIYFQAHKLNEDMKAKAEKKGVDTDDEDGDNDSQNGEQRVVVEFKRPSKDA